MNGHDGTHLAERAVRFFVQRPEPERTDVARPVVARRHRVVLDWLSAYPADRRIVVVLCIAGLFSAGALCRGVRGLLSERRSDVCGGLV